MKEQLKMVLRSQLRRHNLELTRHPYLSRLANTLRWLNLTDVIDVGANIGQYGSALRSVGYSGRIISCEPLADAFTHLSRRAARDAHWYAVRTAIGSSTGKIGINVSANSYSSSVKAMTATHLHAAPTSTFLRSEQVDMTTVSALATTFSVKPGQSMLKVDTQGSEGEVLDGAADVLQDFAAVQLELSFVPLYETQELVSVLSTRMRANDFELFNLEAGMADPATGQLLQCDGLFVNKRHLADRPSVAAFDL